MDEGLESKSRSSPSSPAIRSFQVIHLVRVIPAASSGFQAWVKCGVPRTCSLSSLRSHTFLLGMGSAAASCLVPLLLPFCMTQFSCVGTCNYSWKSCFLLPGPEYSSQDKTDKLSSQPRAFFLKTAPCRTWAINCEQTNEIVIPFLASCEDTAVSRME